MHCQLYSVISNGLCNLQDILGQGTLSKALQRRQLTTLGANYDVGQKSFQEGPLGAVNEIWYRE